MNLFNRIVATLLWLTLMSACLVAAIVPLQIVDWLQGQLTETAAWLHAL